MIIGGSESFHASIDMAVELGGVRKRSLISCSAMKFGPFMFQCACFVEQRQIDGVSEPGVEDVDFDTALVFEGRSLWERYCVISISSIARSRSWQVPVYRLASKIGPKMI